ncbi:tyrosyl-tRNA synthetase [Hydrogenispora ethanolica]|uniref:Tyrosine--tRNA ligase n=1 Tax=Hydrogenispora ethanolica TaxID=1082276 RepID=A0A4R1RY80_HYDET|nr:tyrosine--tRNA ligase [Hydrogenispora ethanolica]TCL71666.1 tyrosyl-tRNA synthetase [Hydrogenispora ethanolica]
MSVFETLQERGFIQQTTHQEPLYELLEKEKVTFYVGFDPTADSLHVGHLLPVMAMAHMQRAGHRPIAILGGGTAMIGDPSGKSELRQMLTKETIDHNAECFRSQLAHYLDFSEGKALMVNNGDWLLGLNYLEFLRDIGRFFSVNRMLTAESVKIRLEKGLTFIEFNYMLLQSYDFLMLNRKYGCKLQMGGDDQWSNILAGADLIRRVEGKEAYGVTFPLLTTSSGRKMGKTEAGAVWLDPAKTTPYEFYQYWRNSDDRDVRRFLSLYTFLPMDEVRRLGALQDQAINEAKRVLAFEVTKLAHGEAEAIKADQAAAALFGGGGNEQAVPAVELSQDQLAQGLTILDLLVQAKLADSKSEARRLVTQGGVALNDEKISDLNRTIAAADFKDGKLLIKKGKKQFQTVKLI